MGFHLNLQSLITSILTLGYRIEFSNFGSTLNINISKKINNNDINEYIVKQNVPFTYMNDINKMEKLINFMCNKLDEILKQNNM